eukprot:XP_017952485.1 PREDICTED: T-lymphocyte surface antigen Ly-9-like [Xenopus tropicalis]
MQILLAELLCFFTALTSAENAALVVHRLLNQSVTFSHPKLNVPLNAVYWSFIHNGTESDRLADITDQQMTVHSDQFANRTENNGKELQISELRMEDSGTFQAVLIPKGKVQLTNLKYNLIVYEPVPVPHIETLARHSAELCNLTLQCSVPTNTKSLIFSWKTRHRDLGYQPYTNGSTISVSLRPELWGNEYFCIVQNPVDQKNVSFAAQDVCRGERQPFLRSYFLLLPAILILLLLIAGLIILMRRKNKKAPAPTNGNTFSDPLYIEVERNQQSEINQQREAIYSQPKRRDLPPKSSMHTIYSVIRHNT